ncbi:homeodomain interacting protein kinase [Sarotherodon galilaeus]
MKFPAQKILKLPTHKLVTDGVTRWNSTLEMLERFLEQQPAISAALLSPEVRRSDGDLCTLTEADITDGEDIVKALKPLKAATLLMSEEKSPTLSIIAPLYAQLLEKMISVSHDSSLIKDLETAVYNNLKSIFMNYVYVARKDKLYTASALDPRFKAMPFLSKEAYNNTFCQLVMEAAVWRTCTQLL